MDFFVLNVSCNPTIPDNLEAIDINTSKADLFKKLKGNGWLFAGEQILSVESPGEGNMNVVLRIKTNKRSFVLKQSRPYVQKYKDIKAPKDRIDVEYRFYRSVKDPLALAHFPRILAYDPSHYLMQIEDLGECRDMTYWYEEQEIQQELLSKLIDILSAIHSQEKLNGYPANRKLRELNHQHIFVLPFLDHNGFALDEVQKGLNALAAPYKRDKKLQEVVTRIGKRYLSPGNVLLHGDYYPGSWMSKKNKVYVIDPEFSFMGFPEFDLGVMAAHTLLATGDRKYMKTILQEYQGACVAELVSKVAGIEIIRRLIGLAQLPLTRSLEEKDYLLQTAREMILV